jgi:hypothetical protein
MRSSIIYIPGDSTFGLPTVGEGWDFVDDAFEDQKRERAIQFEQATRDGDGTVVTGVHELKSSQTTTDDFSFDISVQWQEKISGGFGYTSYDKILEENSLFVFTASVVKSTTEAKDGTLSVLPQAKTMALAGDDGPPYFRKKYGYYYVAGIDYGGTVYFFYRFRSRDVETRDKITASINAASYGSSKLSTELTARGVSTDMQSLTVIAGGSPVISLTSDLGQNSSILAPWVTTIGTGRPIRLRLCRYNDQFPNLPDLGGFINLDLHPNEFTILRKLLNRDVPQLDLEPVAKSADEKKKPSAAKPNSIDFKKEDFFSASLRNKINSIKLR